jgi:hypothetical protein
MSRAPDGRSDAGTTVPLVLLCFLLAGTLVTATAAASAAFLAQRDLAARCDGAAVAAATAVVPTRSALRLEPDRVRAIVARHSAGPGPAMSATATTDGATVTVVCRRTVRIPFGAVLGHPDGLDRTAVARARSRLVPPDPRPST